MSEVEQLKKEIEALKARIASLEMSPRPLPYWPPVFVGQNPVPLPNYPRYGES